MKVAMLQQSGMVLEFHTSDTSRRLRACSGRFCAYSDCGLVNTALYGDCGHVSTGFDAMYGDCGLVSTGRVEMSLLAAGDVSP